MKVGNLVKSFGIYAVVLKNNDGYILIRHFDGYVCWITESWLEVIA
mgnify:CR=1 FL=1